VIITFNDLFWLIVIDQLYDTV